MLALRSSKLLRTSSILLLRTSSRALSTSYPPHEIVPLPALSPTMEFGGIARWSKKVGDPIIAGDILVEVETDKATVDFEAQDDAFLAKILINEGTSDLPVGTPIAVLVEEEEDIAAFVDFVPPSMVVDTPAAAAPVVDVAAVAAAPVAAAPVVAVAAAVAAPVVTAAPAGDIDGSLTFERYGDGVRRSALSAYLLAEQEQYQETYGSTLLESQGGVLEE